ncbi:MAG: transcription antitermination factor NusB [Victivallaceae bacterium]|nr:transcription antitermination factor NusB [Victivallaceae bacterium]
MNGNDEDNPIRPHSKRLGREIAMQFLFACDVRGEIAGAAQFDAFFETVQSVFQLKDDRLARRAKEYAATLYTKFELSREKIDETIAAHAKNWKIDRLSAVDRNLLRVAVAEMLGCDDVPSVVSIDEAVGIARDYSGPEAGNFINGLLNAIKDDLK